MKKLKPIQLFESYKGDEIVLISDIDYYDVWKNSDVYKYGADFIMMMALSRILNIPITGILGYEVDNEQYPDKEIIIHTILYLKDSYFINTEGIHKLISNDPSDIEEYLNTDGYMYHSMYFKTMSEMDIINYITPKIEQQNEIKHIVTDAVETINTECTFISKIYEFCIKHNIDIGLSDDVKDIGRTAMKGNHKLR